jgi:hypothetical protein
VFIITCVLAADAAAVVVVVVKITDDVTVIHILQSHSSDLENPWFMDVICISAGNF